MFSAFWKLRNMLINKIKANKSKQACSNDKSDNLQNSILRFKPHNSFLETYIRVKIVL